MAFNHCLLLLAHFCLPPISAFNIYCMHLLYICKKTHKNLSRYYEINFSGCKVAILSVLFLKTLQSMNLKDSMLALLQVGIFHNIINVIMIVAAMTAQMGKCNWD